MKNLIPADVILVVKVLKRGREFVLMQSHYIENVWRKFNHFDCKPSKTPIDPHVKLVPNEGTTINQGEYAKIIGSIMYAVNHIRTNLVCAIGIFSRFTSKLNDQL